MDKNVFIKKYNPDVINKFSSRNQQINLSEIQYKKEVWKGITGDEFKNDIKSPDDFIIKFDKPNLNTINSKHNDELASRQKEIYLIEEKNKKIKEAALQNYMKIDLNTSENISEKIQTKTHNELKQIQINDNDLLKEEKEKFNNLLKNLENII
jgi:hypothetical protein